MIDMQTMFDGARSRIVVVSHTPACCLEEEGTQPGIAPRSAERLRIFAAGQIWLIELFDNFRKCPHCGIKINVVLSVHPQPDFCVGEYFAHTMEQFVDPFNDVYFLCVEQSRFVWLQTDNRSAFLSNTLSIIGCPFE